MLKKFLLNQFKRLAIALFTLAIAFQVFTATAIAVEVYDIPELPIGDRTWVQDMAKVLSSTTEGAVRDKIDELAEKTDFQVRFLTVRRIDFGQPTQEFTDLVFDKWFATPESKTNQALIVFATEDHRTAIATGERVKAALSDAIAASITDETMLFPAKKSNYNQAAIDGINRLAAILTGEPDPGPPKVVEVDLPQSSSNFKTAEETDGSSSTIVVIGLLIAATVIPMVTYFWFQNQS
ncbi:photosystem II repair protein Psb32 [Pseudanabaena sp. PCC 6802]|uniref:photosystem II repair protein Psb32 n=1 Tax=Pseudanabaena sp. PCC 6802 TaxID=118173 RepID=UPI000348ED22|nr:TPM domain-containing protein [Pseudanabaena sp. PCC 6802]